MGPLSHVFFLSPGRLGPARAEVGLGFAVVGWFRRFRPPHPPLVWFRFRQPPFSLSLPFQGLPVLGQVCLCRCLLFPSSFSLPSSRPGWVTFISFSFSFHFHCHFICPLLRGVCVCNIWIDVKLLSFSFLCLLPFFKKQCRGHLEHG